MKYLVGFILGFLSAMLVAELTGVNQRLRELENNEEA
jgi:hypothetical protein